MTQARNVLVVDDSDVYQELVSTVLRSHCDRVVTVSTLRSAIDELDRSPDISLVLCDVKLGDDDGFEVLEHVAERAQRAEPRPKVIMVSASESPEDRKRATAANAGYLVKPTTVDRVLELWLSDRPRIQRASPRVAVDGSAHVVDPNNPDRGYLAWELYNISATGAFMNTNARLTVDSEFDMVMELDTGKARVRVRVVRVQEPTWVVAGGCAVRFIDMDDDSEAVINAALAADS
jgi:CheY-like chemotaxis protein